MYKIGLTLWTPSFPGLTVASREAPASTRPRPDRPAGTHLPAAARSRDDARAARAHSVGPGARREGPRLARHRVPLFPQPEQARERGGGGEPGPGAPLRAHRRRRARPRARAVRQDVPALQTVRAAHAGGPAPGARARIAGADGDPGGRALPARPPALHAAPGCRAA